MFVAVTPRLLADSLSDALRRRGVRTTGCEHEGGLLVVDEGDPRPHRPGTLRLELPTDGAGLARLVTDHGVAAAILGGFEGVLALVATLSVPSDGRTAVPRELRGDDGPAARA